MNLRPITCKYCSEVIKEPTRIVGESIADHHKRMAVILAQHLHKVGQKEARESVAKANGKPFRPQPHHAAIELLRISAEGITEYLVATHFNLSEDLEVAVEIGRHSIHEASRKVRMTDEDVESILPRWLDGELKPIPKYDGITQVARELARDLRDRYEGLGKYAPAQPTPAPGPEPVKG